MSFFKKIFILLISICTSCGWHSPDQIIGNFETNYPDEPKDRNLIYNSQCVFSKKSVAAIGYNEKYIIAKTYRLNDTIDLINMNDVKYYIIDMPTYINDPYQEQSKGVLGPYNENEFLIEKHVLKIDNLNFTKFYSDVK